MILAETLKCTVPSPNAVKDATIYCVTNPTNATDMWIAIAGVATALFTLGLFVGAVLAWRSSVKQIEIAKKTEKTTFDGMQAQILANEASNNLAIKNSQDLAKEEQQLNALAEYLAAYYAVLASSNSEPTVADEATKRLVTAGILWRLTHSGGLSTPAFTHFEACLCAAATMTASEGAVFTKETLAVRNKRISAMEQGFEFALKEITRFHRKDISAISLGIRMKTMTKFFLETAPDVEKLLESRRGPATGT